MPKRCRSEDEENVGYCRHLKTHVSERELGTGVLKELNMKTIYEKTLALLFRGQKNVANNNAEAVQVSTESHDTQKYRQLSLSSSGSRLDVQSKVSLPVGKCCSCINVNCQETRHQCTQCGGKVGSSCVQVCGNCAAVASCGNCEAVRPCNSCGSLTCYSCSSVNGGIMFCSLCQT
eukprot:TRINITY_DN11056_c0_g1_i4.p1 TRINITY_DN11056_c0_g1~~TRINITY_DN11056_c0_g1_i4.p1  ORF type:complete len:176 (+),score=24.77 TRINITY_DN11056_c0_g1_i4:40-567(+)